MDLSISFRALMLVLMTLGSGVPAGVTAYLMLGHLQDSIEARANFELKQQLSNISQRLQFSFESALLKLQFLANNPDVQAAATGSVFGQTTESYRASEYFHELVNDHPIISGLYLLDLSLQAVETYPSGAIQPPQSLQRSLKAFLRQDLDQSAKVSMILDFENVKFANTMRRNEGSRFRSNEGLIFAMPIVDAAGDKRGLLLAAVILDDAMEAVAQDIQPFQSIQVRLGERIVIDDAKWVGSENTDEMLSDSILFVLPQSSKMPELRYRISIQESKRHRYASLSDTVTDLATWILTGLAVVLIGMSWALSKFLKPIQVIRQIADQYLTTGTMPADPKNLIFQEFIAVFEGLKTLGVKIEKQITRTQETLEKTTKANEQLLAIDAARSQYFETTSQALYNPLNTIIALSEASLGPKATVAQTKDAIKTVYYIAKSTATHVRSLTDFFLIKQGRLTTQKVSISLRQAVELAMVQLASQARAKNITFANRVNDGLSPVFCDENYLNRILLPVLERAVLDTDSGSVEAFAIEHSETKSVTLTIKDTGSGLTHEQASSLFLDPDSLFSEPLKLELSLSRYFARHFGGNIWISSSEIGRGTTISITLPTGEGLPQGSALPAMKLVDFEDAHPDRSSVPAHSVLVADDDPVFRRVYRHIIESLGYGVIEASQGIEALASVERSRPNVVLLDALMPKLGGIEVCKRIRTLLGDRDVPVVITTQRGYLGDVGQAVTAGATDIIEKSIDPKIFRLRIENYVSLSDLKRNHLADHYANKLIIDRHVAQSVQASLLPSIGDIPGIEIDTYFRSAQRLGGDWYDVFHDQNAHRLYLVVCDVIGHNLASGFVAAMICGAIRSYHHGERMTRPLPLGESLIPLANAANFALVGGGERGHHLATMALVGIDLNTGEMAHLNAAHPPLFWLEPNRAQMLGRRSPMLGSQRNMRWAVQSHQLKRGDGLFLYTDGLLDNQGPQGQRLLVSRLRRSLQDEYNQPPRSINQKILRQIESLWAEGKRDDDFALLSLRWDGPKNIDSVSKVS